VLVLKTDFQYCSKSSWGMGLRRSGGGENHQWHLSSRFTCTMWQMPKLSWTRARSRY